jgi:hypothetical protein
MKTSLHPVSRLTNRPERLPNISLERYRYINLLYIFLLYPYITTTITTSIFVSNSFISPPLYLFASPFYTKCLLLKFLYSPSPSHPLLHHSLQVFLNSFSFLFIFHSIIRPFLIFICILRYDNYLKNKNKISYYSVKCDICGVMSFE